MSWEEFELYQLFTDPEAFKYGNQQGPSNLNAVPVHNDTACYKKHYIHYERNLRTFTIINAVEATQSPAQNNTIA